MGVRLVSKMCIGLAAVGMLLGGCSSGKGSGGDASATDAAFTTEAACEKENTAYVSFSLPSGLYSKDVILTLEEAEGVKEIRYTLDGSKPMASSVLYDGDITLSCGAGDFPKAYSVRAVGVMENGEMSEEYSETYLLGKDIESRFTTPVFLIWGNPAELTEAPNGIFYGKNAKKSGRDSEREIYAVAFDKDGNRLFNQEAGVRVYGKASRSWSVKSLKLYARKEYGKKKFNVGDILGAKDTEGDDIVKYKRLVLRNTGNDFQFAFIRDEFCQRLAVDAGFSDYERTSPAVAYVNGDYYGFYYLHESYCDEYFKDKYKKSDENMSGEFAVIEGGDSYKAGTDENETDSYDAYAAEYQKSYEEFIKLDLKDEENFKRLSDFIDVNNYLDYFAFNIYPNNWDWPQNNYKCYRYYADENTSYGDGVYDGRWRFLLHDIDYTYGIYGQDRSSYKYDNLKLILKEGDERYAPLFAKLMERADCREYFLNKINEYMETVFSPEYSEKVLNEMLSERESEMVYFYRHLDSLRRAGDDSIWSHYSDLKGREDEIREFIRKRPDYMKKYLAILEN